MMRSSGNAVRRSESVRPQNAPVKDTSIVRGLGTMDHTVYLIVVILALFGVMMVFSATYVIAGRSANLQNNTMHFLIQHGRNVLIGFVLMNIASNINYHYFKRFTFPLYLASLGMLLFLAIYSAANATHGRWIEIDGLGQFQPSEIAKASLIFLLARIMSKNRRILDKWPGFLFCAALVGIMVVFVGYGDLGTAIIVGITGGGMIFLASPHILRFVLLGVAGVGGMYGFLYLLASNEIALGAQFRGDRFLAWQNPFDHMQDIGFQIVQSLYAIASGGIFGLGIGQSRQKAFLPEVHNDVIFSVIVEELGIMGAGIILILFAFLAIRGLRIAINAPDNFGSLVAAGIIIMIVSQVVVNVAVVTNTIPNTGIPMPFISYGGTAIVICMGLAGVLLNISRHTRVKG